MTKFSLACPLVTLFKTLKLNSEVTDHEGAITETKTSTGPFISTLNDPLLNVLMKLVEILKNISQIYAETVTNPMTKGALTWEPLTSPTVQEDNI